MRWRASWGGAPPAAYANGYGSVGVNKSNSTITIGNDAISRTFSVADGRLTTVEINNKLASTKLVPDRDPKNSSFSRSLRPRV